MAGERVTSLSGSYVMNEPGDPNHGSTTSYTAPPADFPLNLAAFAKGLVNIDYSGGILGQMEDLITSSYIKPTTKTDEPITGLDLSGTAGIKSPVGFGPPPEAIQINKDGSVNPDYDPKAYEEYIDLQKQYTDPADPLGIQNAPNPLDPLNLQPPNPNLFEYTEPAPTTATPKNPIDEFFTRIKSGANQPPRPAGAVEPVTGRTDTWYQPKYQVGSSLQGGQNMWGDASELMGLLGNSGEQGAAQVVNGIIQGAIGQGDPAGEGPSNTGSGYSGLAPSSIDVPDSVLGLMAAVNPQIAALTKIFTDVYNVVNQQETVTKAELDAMQAELDAMHEIGINTDMIQTQVDAMLGFNVNDLGYDVSDLPEALVNPNIVGFDADAAIADATTSGGSNSSGDGGDTNGFGSGGSDDSGAVASPADMSDGIGEATPLGGDDGFGSDGGDGGDGGQDGGTGATASGDQGDGTRG